MSLPNAHYAERKSVLYKKTVADEINDQILHDSEGREQQQRKMDLAVAGRPLFPLVGSNNNAMVTLVRLQC